ncbi:MAG: hypothetical protein NTZ39_07145 [Methanoregula sp.]|nr:hypothetical protein [Methanoregula sp.]
MALEDFKEALGLLRKLPVLWIPGVVAGLLTACLWIILDIDGTFFASRLLIVFGLVSLLFIAGMLAIIKKGEGGIRALVSEGIRYYFRVLLPLVVIIFAVTMIILVFMMAATLAIGGTPDISILTVISLCIMIPAILLTLFFDTAAVFEDCRVFASIRRSVTLASSHAREVIGFFLVCAACCFIVVFGLMMIWEAVLYAKLEPITTYNETQMAALTPEQFLTIVGHDGIWVTAIVCFVGVLILVPLLITYKTCFFRKIAGTIPVIQQQTGEYDSKGRWYKY